MGYERKRGKLADLNSLLRGVSRERFSVVVEGRIAPAGDVDFYKFYEDSPGILTVEFQGLPPEMKARITDGISLTMKIQRGLRSLRISCFCLGKNKINDKIDGY